MPKFQIFKLFGYRNQVDRFHVDEFKRDHRKKSEKLALFSKAVELLTSADKCKYERTHHTTINKAKEIIESLPNDSLSQYNLGLCYEALSQRVNAENSFIQALKLDRWNEAGLNIEETKTNCRRFIAEGILSDEGARILYAEAFKLIDKDQYQEAYSLLEKLPLNGRVQYHLALCSFYLQKGDESLARFQNLMKEGPFWAPCSQAEKAEFQNNAKYYIGQIKMERSKTGAGNEPLLTEARESLLQCQKPYSVYVLQSVAISYEEQGNLDEALVWYKKALEADFSSIIWQQQMKIRSELNKKIQLISSIDLSSVDLSAAQILSIIKD